MEYKYLKNIKDGMKVKILTSQNKYSVGYVGEIAVRSPFHEEGIMVRLKNGDVGRVKEIILNEVELNEKSAVEVKKFLEKGENFHTEFKAEALWSATYNPIQLKESKSFELREYGQRASKIIIAKSIAAFLNSDGGNLIIGVKEKKEERKFEIQGIRLIELPLVSNPLSGEFERKISKLTEFSITGIEEDMKKAREQGIDGYKRILIDEVIRAFFPSKIFNHLNDYINFEFVNMEGRTVCWIKIKKSDSRVFLKLNEREIFMIRVDSENRTLDGEKLVDYCIKKWGR